MGNYFADKIKRELAAKKEAARQRELDKKFGKRGGSAWSPPSDSDDDSYFGLDSPFSSHASESGGSDPASDMPAEAP